VESVLRSIYRRYGIHYPKFYKMDNLSKLGFLSAEILFQGTDVLKGYPEEGIGIVLGNASSSLETDRKHQESIGDRNDYFASPSVFVYTLANIMIGEMAIRHKMKGENALFISEQFAPALIFQVVSELFQNERVDCCLTGWIECCDQRFESFLCLVERADRIKRLKKPGEWFIFDLSNLEQCFFERKY